MGLCAPAPRRGCTWACPPPLPKVSERCGEDVWGCRGGQEGAGNQSWSDGMLHRAKAQHCKPWGGRWGRGCGCPVCLQGGMREWGQGSPLGQGDMCPQWRQSCSPPLTLPWPSTQAPGGNTAPNATSHGHPPSSVHVPAQLSLSSVHQPRAQPCTHLLPFRLPSSESALQEPLFLESQDFTPSTRSSSSESTSESPSLPEERVRVEESKRSARGSEVLGTGEMEVQ